MIDGYVKIEVGALPNNTVKSVPSNIPEQATEYWIEKAWCKHRSTNQVDPIPYINPKVWNDAIGVSITPAKNIAISTSADWTTYDAYVIVGYKL